MVPRDLVGKMCTARHSLIWCEKKGCQQTYSYGASNQLPNIVVSIDLLNWMRAQYQTANAQVLLTRLFQTNIYHATLRLKSEIDVESVFL